MAVLARGKVLDVTGLALSGGGVRSAAIGLGDQVTNFLLITRPAGATRIPLAAFYVRNLYPVEHLEPAAHRPD